MENQKFWQGTNFWFAALMFVFSFFGGTEDLAQQIVSTAVGVIALFGAVRQFLPSLKFTGFKAALAAPNTWNYLSGVLVLLVPQAGELVPALREVYDALILGNWGLVISRGIAFLTILFYIFKKKA
jgi:hypothetical protein